MTVLLWSRAACRKFSRGSTTVKFPSSSPSFPSWPFRCAGLFEKLKTKKRTFFFVIRLLSFRASKILSLIDDGQTSAIVSLACVSAIQVARNNIACRCLLFKPPGLPTKQATLNYHYWRILASSLPAGGTCGLPTQGYWCFAGQKLPSVPESLLFPLLSYGTAYPWNYKCCPVQYKLLRKD